MKNRYVILLLCMCCTVGIGACQIAGTSDSMSALSFTLTYQLHNGLDCFMIQDCGYKVEVASSGVATLYQDSGNGSLTLEGERVIPQETIANIARILEEKAFQTMPDQVPVFSEENADNPPVMGAGTVTISVLREQGGDVKTVRVLKGNPLPANTQALLNDLQPVLLALFD